MRECCGRIGSHAQTPEPGVRRAGCTRSVRQKECCGRPEPCRKAKIPILNEKSGPQAALFNRFGKGFSRCSLLGGLLRKKDLPVFVPHRLDAAVVRHPGGSTTMDSASTRLAGRITTNLQHCWYDKVYNRVGIFVVLAVEIVRGHERHSEESDADRPPRKSEPAARHPVYSRQQEPPSRSYASSVTGSSHSVEHASPATSNARCANQLSAAAPCQCFTLAGI